MASDCQASGTNKRKSVSRPGFKAAGPLGMTRGTYSSGTCFLHCLLPSVSINFRVFLTLCSHFLHAHKACGLFSAPVQEQKQTRVRQHLSAHLNRPLGTALHPPDNPGRNKAWKLSHPWRSGFDTVCPLGNRKVRNACLLLKYEYLSLNRKALK